MRWGRGTLWWVVGVLPACAPADAPVVVAIGPHRIDADALRAYVEQLPAADLGLLDAAQPQDAAAVRRQYLQLIIDRYLLQSAARAQGLDSTQLAAAEIRAYYQDPYPATLKAGAPGALLARVRQQRGHEVRVYPEPLERALPDSLLTRKARQWGALLSQRGEELLKQGRHRRALAVLKRAAAHAPGLAQTHFYMGLAHARLNENEQAAPAFERAIALAPEQADLHYALGTTLQMQHQYEGAAACFQRAIAQSADQPHYHFRLGEARRSLADFEGALTAYDEVLALQPDHAQALHRRSDLLTRSGDLVAAAAMLKKVLALAPENAAALVDLAGVYIKQRHPAAVATLERALQLNPADYSVYYRLSLAYAQAGQPDQAAAAAAEFQRLSAVDRHYKAGLRNANRGSWDRAAVLLTQAVEADSSHLRARIRLGMVYLYQDAPARGISVLQRALALAPDHVEVHCLLGEAYAASGQPDSARHFFNRALGVDSTSVRAHYGSAKVAYQAGDPRAAAIASQRALTIDPDHRDSHYLLGLAHLQLGQPRKAWRSFQACIELDPGDAEALYRQGLLLMRHGSADAAQRTLGPRLAARSQPRGGTTTIGAFGARAVNGI